MPGSATHVKPEIVFFSGAIPVRFFSRGGAQGGRSRCSARQPTDQQNHPSSIHPRSNLDPTSIHPRSNLDPTSIQCLYPGCVLDSLGTLWLYTLYARSVLNISWMYALISFLMGHGRQSLQSMCGHSRNIPSRQKVIFHTFCQLGFRGGASRAHNLIFCQLGFVNWDLSTGICQLGFAQAVSFGEWCLLWG